MNPAKLRLGNTMDVNYERCLRLHAMRIIFHLRKHLAFSLLFEHFMCRKISFLFIF